MPHFAQMFPNNLWCCISWLPGGAGNAFGSDDDPDTIFKLSIQRGRVLYEIPPTNYINQSYDGMFPNNEFVAVPLRGSPFGTDDDPDNVFPNGCIQRGFVLYET
jgi:hypothetical protein